MPKKKTQQYIDPRNAAGFAYLLNADTFGRALATQTEAVLDYASRVDALQKAFARQLARQRLEELGEENTITDTETSTPNNEIGFWDAARYANMSSTAAGLMGEALGTALHRGSWSDVKDNYNSFLSKMNEVQSSSAKGIADASTRLKTMINNATRYYNALLQLPEEQERLRRVQQQAALARTPQARLSLLGYAATIQLTIDDLNNDIRTLKSDADNLASESHQSEIGAAIDLAMSGSSRFGSWLWGKTTPLHDRTNDIKYHLQYLGDKDVPIQNKLKMLKEANDAADNVLEDMKAIQDENTAEAMMHERRISEGFKKKRDTHGMDFTDPDTYLYKLSGVMGSSASSWMKLAPAMLGGIIAGATAVPTGGMSLVVGAPLLFSLNQASGRDENYAEVLQAVNESFTNKLTDEEKQQILNAGRKLLHDIKDSDGNVYKAKDFSDSEVIDQYLAGNINLSNKNIERKRTETAYNIPSLFNRDMAATTWGSTVDTALSLMPVGALSGLSRLRWVKALRKPFVMAERAAEQSGLGRAVMRDARYWAKLGATGSVAGTGLGGAVGAGLGVAEYGVEKALTRIVPLDKMGVLGRAITNRMNGASKVVKELTEDLIKALAKREVRKKYAKDITGKLFLSSVSEGVEEGKQHKYAEQFKRGDFKYGDDSFINMAIDDTLNGLEMSSLILGIPLDGIGLLTQKDQDLLTDIKGGMLGGFQHVGTINLLLNIRPYKQEIRAVDAITNNLIATKTEAQDLFNKNVLYAKGGLNAPSRQRYQAAFDLLRQYNRNHRTVNGDHIIDPDLLDQEEDRMNSVMSLMNNDFIRSAALKQGILRGVKDNITNNEKYQRFVSAVALMQHYVNLTMLNRDNIASQEDSIDYEQQGRIIELVRNTLGQSLGLNIEDDVDQTVAKQMREDQQSKIDQLISDKIDFTKSLARLAALYGIRKNIEEGLDVADKLYDSTNGKQRSRIKNGLKDYLKYVDEQIDRLQNAVSHNAKLLLGFRDSEGALVFQHANDTIRTLNDILKLIVDPEAHDKYMLFYRDLYQADAAVNMHQASLNKILGDDKNAWKDLDKQLTETKMSDDEFWEAFETHDFDKDEAETQMSTEDGWNAIALGEDRDYVPVFDGEGKQAVVELDEKGVPKLHLADGMVADKDGRVWKAPNVYNDRPIFGEWDRSQDSNTEEEFDGMLTGNRVRISPKDKNTKLMSLLLKDLRAQAKRRYEAELEQNIYIDESDEGGNTVTLTPEEERQAQKSTAGKAAMESYKRQRKADSTKRKKIIGKATDSGVVVQQDEQEYKVYKDDKTGDYFIVRKRANGSYFRDYNIDTSNLFVDTSTSQGLELIDGTPTQPDDGSSTLELIDTYEQIKAADRVVPKAPDIPKQETISAQLETIDKLNKKRIDDELRVGKDPNGYHLTGQAYFIKNDNGRYIRYPRVHSVKPEYIFRPLEQIDFTYFQGRLNPMSIDQLLDWLDERISTDTYEEAVKSDLRVYHKYLTDSRSFIEKDTRELSEIKRDIAHILSSGDYGISVVAGNVVDLVSRTFFGSHSLYEEFIKNRDSYTDRVMELPLEQYSGRKVGDYFTKDAIRELLDDLALQLKNFDDNGWKLSTYGYTWHSDFAQTKVAGVTDLVAVDKDGKIHIIDFKTSKYPFSGPNSYFLLLRLVPGGTKMMSTKDDYTNQLTLYAMMVKDALGDDVASIELMPFVLQYDNANQTFPVLLVRNNDNGKPSRITLERSEDPFDSRFTKQVGISKEKANRAKDKLEYLNETVSNQNNLTLEFVLDAEKWEDGYPELEQIKQYLSDTTNTLANVVHDVWNNDDFDFQNDADYDTANSYIDALSKEADKWRSMADLMMNLRHKHSDYLNSKKPPMPPSAPKPQENIPGGPSFGFADNKGFGLGANGYVNIYYKMLELPKFRDLSDATLLPDFITNSVIQVYSKNEGGVIDLYANITYNGKTWNNILLATQHGAIRGHKTPVGQALIDKVVALEKANPGKKVYAIPTLMNRTNGRIVYEIQNGQPVVRPVSETDLVQDLYDVDFTQDYGMVGFYQGGRVVVFDKGNVTLRKPIYTYTGVETSKYGQPATPLDGLLVWLKKMRHDESGELSVVPVTVRRKTYSRNDADFIIDAIINNKLYDTYRLPDGTDTHIQIRRLINFLMPLASMRNTETIEGIYSLVTDDGSPIVRLLTREQLATNQTDSVQTYDLSTDAGKDAFRDTLSKLYIEELHDVLAARFGQDKNDRMPFLDIYRYFANSEANNLHISDTLDFDISDFSNHKSQVTGKSYSGLSGAGWYVKHGIWTTTYHHMGHANVSIGRFNMSTGTFVAEPVLVEDPTISSDSDAFKGLNLPPTDASVVDGTDITSLADGFWSDTPLFKRDDNKKHGKRVSKERVFKRLNKILGEDAPVEFLETIDELSLLPAGVLGRCSTDAVLISKLAFDGVEFHEAFHRILELVISDEQRDKIYEQISKKNGFSLNNRAGRTQVAEYAADGFMDFMKWHIERNIPLLTKAWNKVADFIYRISHYSQRDLYRAYIAAYRGEYANKEVSKDHIARWHRSFKDHLNYDVHGVHFEHVMNDYMYNQLKDTTMMFIVKGADIDRSGSDLNRLGHSIDRATFKKGIDWYNKVTNGDVLGEHTDNPTVGQKALSEMYENLQYDDIRTDIADQISFLATDYKKQFEEASDEDADGGGIGGNIGEHTRLSYEFSRFSKTSARVRFFFATIPDQTCRLIETKDKNGLTVYQKQYSFVLNELGLPKYAPVAYVFNDFLNKMHDCDSVQEILLNCAKYGQTDPIYSVLYAALNNIYRNTYVLDKQGKLHKNDDYEALLVQLIGTIRSNKHNFKIMRSTFDKNGPSGQYTLSLYDTDMEYNANNFTIEWGLMLVNGGTPYIITSKTGQPILNPNIKDVGKMYNRLADQFDHSEQHTNTTNNSTYYIEGLKQWLNSVSVENGDIKRNRLSYFQAKVVDQLRSTKDKTVYKTVNLDNPSVRGQLDIAKDQLVRMLNAVGISFTRPELDYMLLNKYGDTDWQAMAQMFNSTALEDSITSFVDFLRNLSNGTSLNLNQKGLIPVAGKRVEFANAFRKMAFVRTLANWKYQFQHAHDLLTVLATHGKYYQISENNYITDVTRGLNKRGDEYRELISEKDPYYYYTAGRDRLNNKITYGSYVIRQLEQDPNAQLLCYDFVGFRTDKRADEGLDYFEMSNREDYVAKANLLSQGFIIFPTMSDKKTWKFLTGIALPGLDYNSSVNDKGETIQSPMLAQQKIVNDVDGSKYITPIQEVIDAFIGYAYSEYESVKNAIRDIEQMKRNGDDKYMTANYYAKAQGARFSSLLGIYEDGKFISFNNKNKTPQQCLEIAEQYFFNRPRKEQEMLINRNLMKVLDRELEEAERLGLIERRSNPTSENPYLLYKNVGLDAAPIQAIYKAQEQRIMSKHKGLPLDLITMDNLRSFATVLYLYDVSNRAIMSGQEVERLFSGNPAFYKWKYDSNGNLIDRTVDELKRLGGLISTGNNNFIELKDIPAKYIGPDGNFTGLYNCAEVDNEMIQSPQYDEFVEYMYSGELRTTVYNKLLDERIDKYNYELSLLPKKARPELWEIDRDLENIRREVATELSGKSVSELEEMLDELALGVVKASAKLMSDSYKMDKDHDGIDVADGAAYVTDTMMEMILRMNGSWSADIAKAFEILRNDDITGVLTKASAYRKVITTVIGTLKYTAFGRRIHGKTGIPITYYNKYALFPIFKSMATGKLMNVYNAMINLGIDMLMINSAVKVGSEGSKPISWDSYKLTSDPNDKRPIFSENLNLNIYLLNFKYLRKLLNTDPKEDKYQNFGTQMTKIVESNYIPYEVYMRQNGTTATGKQVLTEIMQSTNALSDIGREEIAKSFFKTDKDGNFVDEDGNVVKYDSRRADGTTRLVLDPKKFAKEVRDALTDKDPNKNIIQALDLLEYVDVDGHKQYKLKAPLDAVQNSKWFESILISRINSKVIDIESPGAPFIQRSVWAMEGSTLYDSRDGKILSDKNMPPTINGGKRLQSINEEGSMDCVLSVDFFRKILGEDAFRHRIKDANGNDIYDRVKDKKGNFIQKKDKNGNFVTDKNGQPVYVTRPRMAEMSFTEIRNFLIQRGIIGPNAKANIVAYRIPTQAQSSIHALRCVDIIPDVNDTVILPAEFTKITGSDFDIDKLFLSAINYDVRREKGEDGKYHTLISDLYEKGSKHWHQNRLLRNYITFLLDKDSKNGKPRHWNILHRSIDNDTKLLKDVLHDIEGEKAGQLEIPYGFYSLAKQTQSKNDYITGKIGIGPYALNNNNHILTMLYNISFKDSQLSLLHELGLTRLDRYNDIDGKPILSWLSGLINAHVDIAKDPWISRLNVGPFTYNLSNLLVRIGLGKNSFYYLAQPIMKDLALAYTNASSMYMQQENSPWQARKKALQATADAWFKGQDKSQDVTTISGIPYREAVNIVTKPALKMARKDDLMRINSDIAEMMKGDKIRNMAKNGGGTKLDQLMVYLAYLQLDKYANALSKLVQYCKIDTKKQGKNVAEQYAYQKGYNQLFDTSSDTNLFEPSGLTRLLQDSYVGRKTDNALECVQDVLGQQFMQSTPSFMTTVDQIVEAIGKSNSVSADLFSTVSDALSAAIKSEYFNEIAQYEHPENPHFMHDLVSSSAEMVGYEIKKNSNIVEITTKPKYQLRSYIGKPIIFWYQLDGQWYNIRSTVQGADATHLYLTNQMPIDISGDRAWLTGGANTIYDRLNRLKVRIHADHRFANLLSPNGEINNLFLRDLIPGKTYEFTPNTTMMQGADLYLDLKFVKLFNFLDEGGNNANYIMDAWDELLHYTNDDKTIEKFVRDFAKDLVYYAFVTSGDTTGFTKIFKYVPISWRTEAHKINEELILSYSDFIELRLLEMDTPTMALGIDIDDILRNNWYNYSLVPTYQMKADGNLNFITVYKKELRFIPQTGRNEWLLVTAYPTILAALHKNDEGKYEAFIDPEEAPRFIKIPRVSYRNMSGSQRDYTLYRLAGIAMSNSGVRYPVYIKDNPKGISVDRYMMTEYSRDDGYTAAQEYEVNYDAFDKYWKSDQFLELIPMIKGRNDIQYLAILQGLRRERGLSDRVVEGKHISRQEGINQIKTFIQGYFEGGGAVITDRYKTLTDKDVTDLEDADMSGEWDKLSDDRLNELLNKLGSKDKIEDDSDFSDEFMNHCKH